MADRPSSGSLELVANTATADSRTATCWARNGNGTQLLEDNHNDSTIGTEATTLPAAASAFAAATATAIHDSEHSVIQSIGGLDAPSTMSSVTLQLPDADLQCGSLYHNAFHMLNSMQQQEEDVAAAAGDAGTTNHPEQYGHDFRHGESNNGDVPDTKVASSSAGTTIGNKSPTTGQYKAAQASKKSSNESSTVGTDSETCTLGTSTASGSRSDVDKDTDEKTEQALAASNNGIAEDPTERRDVWNSLPLPLPLAPLHQPNLEHLEEDILDELPPPALASISLTGTDGIQPMPIDVGVGAAQRPAWPARGPGAYAATPGMELARQATVDYDRAVSSAAALAGNRRAVDIDDNTLASSFFLPHHATSNLVQARSVPQDDGTIGYADPVDLEAAQRKALEQNRKKWCWCSLAASFLLVGFVVVVVVVVFSLGADDGGDSANFGDSPNATPSLLIPLDLVLPDFTMAAITASPVSPQALAYEWMLNDPYRSNYTDQRLYQRFALVTLFYATNGTGWSNNKNWLSYHVHECDWEIVPLEFSMTPIPKIQPTACDNENNGTVVQHLGLNKNNLYGSLPPELSLLSSSLQALTLRDNQFFGTLPSELGRLSELRHFNMYWQFPIWGLSGTLPSEIGLWTHLKMFQLGENALLNGTLPSEIGMWTGE